MGMPHVPVRGRVPVRMPAGALATDGHIYVSVEEMLSDDDRARLRATAQEIVGLPVFIGIRLERSRTASILQRVDDAVAEGVAISGRGQRRRRTARRS